MLAAAVSLLAACTETQPARQLVHVYAMGERINLGHIVYDVFETQWKPMLGEDADPRVPQNRFFILRFGATNSGANNEIIPAMSVEDAAGNVYQELKDGSKVPLWVGSLRQVAPADSIQGTVVFDVAPKRYKLRLWDEDHNNSALVELPLQFDDENRGIPTQH
jgi:hypothetical protein